MKQALSYGIVHEGLEGIVASETRLSHVDGEHGKLVIAGHDVDALALSHDFEQSCALLFEAASDEPERGETVRERLSEARTRAFERLPKLGDALSQPDGMDALRAALSHMPGDSTREQVVAAAAVYTAAWWRVQRNLEPLPPPPAAGHGEALLAMLDAAHDQARVRALNSYLVTVIDHGFNASTFAARVVASTRSDLVSAVVAGVGALKGPLHGGAPGPVLDMLDSVGDSVRAYLEAELNAGRRIMGMGHRVYRQRDPRALVLERALDRLEQALKSADERESPLRARLVLARSVEREAEQLLAARYPGRKLSANVEFYTAVLLSALGIPNALFTPLFACARSAGWAAHFTEQQRRGRLIRPSARYVGAQPVTPLNPA
jgi:citrate synthase